MKTISIKVDGAFPSNMEKVTDKLLNGWYILDKTVIDKRYVLFILQEQIKWQHNNKQ